MKNNPIHDDSPLKMQRVPVSFERRAFLRESAMVTCGIVCFGAVGSLVGCGNGDDEEAGHGGAPPYERKILLDNFEEQLPFYNRALSENKGGAAADWVARDARVYFERLMTEIPYVGDAHNPLPKTLIQSAVALSFYRSLRAAGEEIEQAGNLIVEAAEVGFSTVSEEEHRAQGEYQFTTEWYRIQRFAAKKSQEGLYPGDWVFRYIEGVPDEFDWGWDFTECGILKLYKARHAEELLPYLCVQDFIISKLEGTGLQRTKTLAKGDDCCNFRYRKGREVRVTLEARISRCS